jgi:glycine dehydrogenase subunit 2
MAGFKIIIIPSDSEGMVDLEALKSVVGEKTAGLMITNPNTLGLFEKNISSIAEIIHDSGGLLYYDGANLNAILGKVRPGDMGCDIAHINLHKTFSTPHGGGGPGAGPVCVKKDLEKFLPIPRLEFDGKKYSFNYNRKFSIGKIKSYYGNITVLLRAYIYILMLGSSGLERVSELSVLNANYVARNLLHIPGISLPYGKDIPRKHEVVISTDQMYRDTQVRALDISKRLLDFGIHAPTNYFPLIVPEALMIEPTETESKEELDKLIDAMKKISREAYSNPTKLKDAPSNTTVTRIDELAASHPKTLCLSWRMEKNKQK